MNSLCRVEVSSSAQSCHFVFRLFWEVGWWWCIALGEAGAGAGAGAGEQLPVNVHQAYGASSPDRVWLRGFHQLPLIAHES